MNNLQANGKDQKHLGNPEGEDIVSECKNGSDLLEKQNVKGVLNLTLSLCLTCIWFSKGCAHKTHIEAQNKINSSVLKCILLIDKC